MRLKNFIKGKETWVNLISKDIKLKIIKYLDQKEK